jgi:hypothetical protein
LVVDTVRSHLELSTQQNLFSDIGGARTRILRVYVTFVPL